MLGGQAGSSSRIEKYLGFPNGISGVELAEREHVSRFGAEILLGHEAVRRLHAAPDGRLSRACYALLPLSVVDSGHDTKTLSE